MNIIGYHISDVIANSNGEVCSEPTHLGEYLEWLLEQDNKDTIQVFYHMDYDVANLLRLLEFSEEEGQKLLKEGKISILTTLGRFSIVYYPGKFFCIQRGHHYAEFSNMAQFWDCKFLCTPFTCACKAKEVAVEVYEALTSIGLSPRVLTSPISAYRKEVLDNMGKWVSISDEEEE